MGSQQKEGCCWDWQHVLDFMLTQLQGHFYYPILTFQIASILWRQSGREGCSAVQGLHLDADGILEWKRVLC